MTIQPYDQLYKVVLLTCMVNCTAGMSTPWLCPVVQWSVHWAPSWMTRVLVLSRARHCALETCGGKKKCELCFQAWLNLYINSLLILILMGFVLEIFHFTGWKYCLVWQSYLLILSLLRRLRTLMNPRMAVVPMEKNTPTLILLMDCCPQTIRKDPLLRFANGHTVGQGLLYLKCISKQTTLFCYSMLFSQGLGKKSLSQEVPF